MCLLSCRSSSTSQLTLPRSNPLGILKYRAAVLRTAIACVAMSMGALQADAGQIKAGAVQVLPDRVVNVQGDCSSYVNTLAMPGVTQANGVAHPGFCRYSEYEPLFDGQSLNDYWTLVTQGTSRPYRRAVKLSTTSRGRWCATATALTVTLSAQVQVTRLHWNPTQAPAPMCAAELNRVDPAPTVNTGDLHSRADAILRLVMKTYVRTPPTVTACAADSGAALAALDQKAKALLQTIADRQQQLWMAAERVFDDHGSGAADRCMPQCGLCASGWVGTITCIKSITSPGQSNYQHKETQTWYVGGTSQTQTNGDVIYPMVWTATGSGGIGTSESWNVNTAGMTQLRVWTDAQGVINFKHVSGQIVVHSGMQGSPTSYDENEYLFAPFTSADPKTAAGQAPPDTMHPCGLPAMPGDVHCQVACSWSLALQ